MTACIGEPISWPRLERFALDASDPAIAAHLAACPACRQCLDQIRADVVALPPLVMSATPARPHRRRWLVPALAAAAAAVAVLVLGLRPAPDDPWPRPWPAPPLRLAIKGTGDVTVELVRERHGEISYDARRYAPGDRWKIVLSCPPSAAAWIDVTVADGATTDRPLAPAQLACGNRVVVPGAFTITGRADNQVCATVAAAPGAPADTACATLRPE